MSCICSLQSCSVFGSRFPQARGLVLGLRKRLFVLSHINIHIWIIRQTEPAHRNLEFTLGSEASSSMATSSTSPPSSWQRLQTATPRCTDGSLTASAMTSHQSKRSQPVGCNMTWLSSASFSSRAISAAVRAWPRLPPFRSWVTSKRLFGDGYTQGSLELHLRSKTSNPKLVTKL